MKLALREVFIAREGLLTTSQLRRSEQFRLILTGGAGGGSFGISGSISSSPRVALGATVLILILLREDVSGPPDPPKLELLLNIDSKGDGMECSEQSSVSLGISDNDGDTSKSGRDAAHVDTLGN